jgi:AcrR family transcriptional regulator
MRRMTATAPRRRLPRAEREAGMLEAAGAVFGARGFTAASMDEIAERSGITKALLYQYFGSKHGLYAACVERERAALFDGIADELRGLPPGREQLLVFAGRYFDSIEANRHSWWLLYGEAGSEAVEAMRARNAEAIEAALRAALGPDADLAVLTQAVVGAGEQVGRWWRAHPDVPRDEVVDAFVRIIDGAAAATARR